jgi:spore coat protein CotH
VFEELVGNFDDIDGPGNNAYLRFDEESGRFTVVAWDHNLSFGAMGAMMAGGFPGGGAGGPAAPPPDGAEAPAPPTDPSAPPGGQPQVPPGGFPGGGFPGGGFPGGGGFASMGQNPLVNRFKANETFLALYEQAKTELRESLFTSGTAKEIVDRRAALLLADATDLVDAATVEAEANTIREMVAAP